MSSAVNQNEVDVVDLIVDGDDVIDLTKVCNEVSANALEQSRSLFQFPSEGDSQLLSPFLKSTSLASSRPCPLPVLMDGFKIDDIWIVTGFARLLSDIRHSASSSDVDLSLMVPPSGFLTDKMLFLLHWPTLTTEKTRFGCTADLTNVCTRYAARAVGSLDDLLIVDELQLCRDTVFESNGKRKRTPEYGYPPAFQRLFQEF